MSCFACLSFLQPSSDPTPYSIAGLQRAAASVTPYSTIENEVMNVKGNALERGCQPPDRLVNHRYCMLTSVRWRSLRTTGTNPDATWIVVRRRKLDLPITEIFQSNEAPLLNHDQSTEQTS